MLAIIKVNQMRIFISLILLLFSAAITQACPLVGEYIDFNCNGNIKVTFIGDSIVSGAGDGRKRATAGYPPRFRNALRQTGPVKISINGFPGIKSGQLLSLYTAAFGRSKSARKNRLATRLRNSDLIIVDVGRNDYWAQVAPATTANNIKRLVKLLKKNSKKNGIKAYVAAATLLPTGRGFQAPFINSVNSLMLAQSNRSFPVVVRFDTMPGYLLSYDGLHPGTAGYNWMGNYLKKFFKEYVQEYMQNFHTDFDEDGVYDLLEHRHFKTDKTFADTDGDGYTDGEELFQLFTDPLDPLDPPPMEEPEDPEDPGDPDDPEE